MPGLRARQLIQRRNGTEEYAAQPELQLRWLPLHAQRLLAVLSEQSERRANGRMVAGVLRALNLYEHARKPPPKWIKRMLIHNPENVVANYWYHIYLATPVWHVAGAINALIAEVYRRRQEGEDVELDHIVPLRSPIVCGLHCPDNLQIVPAETNRAKSNHMWPGHPNEPRQLL